MAASGGREIGGVWKRSAGVDFVLACTYFVVLLLLHITGKGRVCWLSEVAPCMRVVGTDTSARKTEGDGHRAARPELNDLRQGVRRHHARAGLGAG